MEGLGHESRVEEVEDGVFYPAYVVAYREPFIDCCLGEGGLEVVGVRVSEVVPVRIW